MILFTYVFTTIIKRKYKILLFIYVALFSIFIIRGVIFAYSIFNQSYSEYYGGTAKVKGKIDAFDYIYKDAHGKKFSLFIFSPPIYTYPYDYLLQWYARKKYGYLPTQEKKGLFYLLIEPDRSKPWSYKGWLETVIKTGTVLPTKVLEPSGFIVQKRFQE